MLFKGHYKAALAGVMMAPAFLLGATSAKAEQFTFGDITVNANATATFGVGIRTSPQDCSFINGRNGGCVDPQGGTMNINQDDGDINVGAWEPYTMKATVTPEVNIRYKNYGAFFRATAFYDYWADTQLGQHSTRFGRRPLTDSARGDSASDAATYDFRMLDAFVYSNFDVGNLPATVRIGNQVVNWGESLFIQGGVNSYMPIDVAAIRTPGAELKQALLPAPAVYGSLGLPANFSIEGYYNFGWKKSDLDAAGTFFGNETLGAGSAYTMGASSISDYPSSTGGTIPIAKDDRPSDQGQFGVALRYYADWLNMGTDMGFYFNNFHSKLPIHAFRFDAGEYQAQYPENIRTYGFSFNTTVAGIAVAGDAIYSDNMPYQVDTVQQAANAVALATKNTSVLGGRTLYTSGFQRGYDRYETINAQLQTLQTFATSNPITSSIGADQIILLSNVGFQYLPDMGSNAFLAINRSNSYSWNPIVAGALAGLGPINNVNCPAFNGTTCTGARYADKFSWGYRLVAIANYNNAFGTSWTVSPTIQWAHGVNGNSAGPIGPGFVEQTKTVTLGVTTEFDASWKASVKYTTNFGNKYRNFNWDKDFLTFDVSYAF